jgi:hypothetical protein
MTSIVADRLCGSIPMITPAVLLLRHSTNRLAQGGHRYFEQNRPLSSHPLPGARQDRKPDESHTKRTGGQPLIVSVPPSAWTESGRTPVLAEVSR